MPLAAGRHIAMVIGPGVRRMAGRGLVSIRGVGRLITMGAGSITTTRGFGSRGVTSTRSEAGGGPRSSPLSILVFHSVTTFAGIHCRTTSAIHIHAIIDVTIRIMAAVDAMDRSEEHTSELQSPCNLVCRLLLEKKKTIHENN